MRSIASRCGLAAGGRGGISSLIVRASSIEAPVRSSSRLRSSSIETIATLLRARGFSALPGPIL